MAISLLYNNQPVRLFEADGDFASGAQAFFYLARTTTPMTVYTDSPLAVPHTWPVIADAYGLLAPIYLPRGEEYKVRIEDALGNVLYAADGIMNPGEAESGGGGGLVVTASQIFQPGDMVWSAAGADRLGWVRCNGKTVSSGTGTGDTANADCEALFAFLWNQFPNSLCAVTPSRGANATADWEAAKSIATLDMRGRGIAGLDDMAAAAANLVQVSTSLGSSSIGATTVAVSSSAGLCAGMTVVCPGVVADGTVVAGIVNATTIVITPGALAINGGTAARFSIFADAQLPGAGGGENTHVQTIAELATHTHEIGPVWTATGVADGSIAGTPAYPFDNMTDTLATGGAKPSNLWTPTRVGVWWTKK
jgi:hypothetical protein